MTFIKKLYNDFRKFKNFYKDCYYKHHPDDDNCSKKCSCCDDMDCPYHEDDLEFWYNQDID